MAEDIILSTEADEASTNGPAAQLARVLVISNEMLLSAQRHEWDRVTEMEEQRRTALSACFAAPVLEEHSELFSEALAAMLHMNEELIALLESAKDEVAIKRTDQVRTSKSLGHYLDIESAH
jgi:hypothetical protein